MLWHAFRFAPSAALALLICLATIFWSFWLLRRSVHYTLDRFLLGFIGLLAVYQGLRLLRDIGLMTLFSSRTLNNVVELTVALLYFLATLIMRLSSEQRRLADFQVRSARAEPRNSLQVSERSVTPAQAAVNEAGSAGIEGQMLHIARLVPLLTDPAFKLYMYLCTRSEPATGCAHVDEKTMAALGKTVDEIAPLLKELEGQGVCRLSNDRPGKRIAVEVFWPFQSTGPMPGETSTDSLIALEGRLRASVQADRKAHVTGAK